jgi:Ca2+-binding EF-hand superfamily protein
LYWGSFIKAVKKEQLRKQLREALDLADKNGETGLIPTNESELRELLDKKNQTMAARAAQERLGKW